MNSGNSPLAGRMGRIGLGCVTFGREIGETEAFAIMDRAVARGVTHFDTAQAYAAGASESVVGAWLASRRPGLGSLVIGTKMLAPYTPERVAECVGLSLKRLGPGGTGLFYMHQWTEEAASPEALGAFDQALRSGSIGALGVSNFSFEQLERVLRIQDERGYAPVRAIQNNHNFAVRHVTPALKQLCERRGIEIVTYSPLGAGFLTGKHKAGVEKGSRFDIIPGHQKVYFNDESWARLRTLEAIAAKTGRSMPELALAWVFRQPGVGTVLVGGRTSAQLDQAFDALALSGREPLSELSGT